MFIRTVRNRLNPILLMVLVVLSINIYNTTELLVINKLEVYILLLITLILISYKKKFPIDLIKINIFWFLSIFYLMIISVLSINTTSSLYFTAYFMIFIFLLLLFSINDRWINPFININMVIVNVLVIFTLLSIIDISDYLRIVALIFKGQSYETIIHLLNYGQYPGITRQTGYNAFFISIGLGILWSKIVAERKVNWISIVAIILFFAMIIATGKRSFLISNILALFFIILVGLGKNKLKTKVTAILLFATVSTIGYFFVTRILEGNILFDKFNNSDISSGRFTLYEEALEIFYSNPLIGYGFNTYSFMSEYNMAAHNVYLQLFAELGIIGALLIITSIFSIFIYSIKLLKKYTKIDSNEKCEVLISIYVQVIFIVYCFFGNPLYNLNLFLAYILFTAIALSKYRSFKKDDV